MKFRKKKKLAQERAIRNMVRREIDKLVEELEKRAKNVELPEEAVEYCKKKDEEFLAGLARLEIPASNASENGRGMKGGMGQE